MSDQNDALKTVVFVDYESWFYGLHNQYNAETDVAGWFKKLKTRGQIIEIYIFGDFEGNKSIAQDRLKLRTLTSNIIDCANFESKKDYTDFIILDRIYQTIIRDSSIQQYIIFTGDGHFSNVSAFLKNFEDKVVGIYAVQGTLSQQLRQSASWVEVIEPDGEPGAAYAPSESHVQPELVHRAGTVPAAHGPEIAEFAAQQRAVPRRGGRHAAHHEPVVTAVPVVAVAPAMPEAPAAPETPVLPKAPAAPAKPEVPAPEAEAPVQPDGEAKVSPEAAKPLTRREAAKLREAQQHADAQARREAARLREEEKHAAAQARREAAKQHEEEKRAAAQARREAAKQREEEKRAAAQEKKAPHAQREKAPEGKPAEDERTEAAAVQPVLVVTAPPAARPTRDFHLLEGLPERHDELFYKKLILDYIRQNAESPTFVPTFTNTVQNVSAEQQVDPEQVSLYLKKLIEQNIVSQKLQTTYCGKVLKGLSLAQKDSTPRDDVPTEE